MNNPSQDKPANSSAAQKPALRIYFLPNLMTAGNLFCGFVALTKIVEADPSRASSYPHTIRVAIAFILLACIFDLLDGRLARWGGSESPFGREFDSLADLISFGVAPAFLVHNIVLKDVFADNRSIGWFIASVYLVCGALRLARFNCLSILNQGGGKDFVGFPIPAAAGLVASLTLFMLWVDDTLVRNSPWRFLLPGILLFLSWMMVSEVRYPSFKTLDLRTRSPFTKLVVAVLFIGSIVVLQEKILYFILPVLFTAYLLYGFIRPYLPRQTRENIEEEEEPDEETRS